MGATCISDALPAFACSAAASLLLGSPIYGVAVFLGVYSLQMPPHVLRVWRWVPFVFILLLPYLSDPAMTATLFNLIVFVWGMSLIAYVFQKDTGGFRWGVAFGVGILWFGTAGWIAATASRLSPWFYGTASVPVGVALFLGPAGEKRAPLADFACAAIGGLLLGQFFGPFVNEGSALSAACALLLMALVALGRTCQSRTLVLLAPVFYAAAGATIGWIIGPLLAESTQWEVHGGYLIQGLAVGSILLGEGRRALRALRPHCLYPTLPFVSWLGVALLTSPSLGLLPRRTILEGGTLSMICLLGRFALTWILVATFFPRRKRRSFRGVEGG